MLDKVIPLLEDTIFKDVPDYCFQRDSAPTHKVKTDTDMVVKKFSDAQRVRTSIPWITGSGQS